MKELHETLHCVEYTERELLSLAQEWRERDTEGKDATVVEGGLFAAAAALAKSRQRLQVLVAEVEAREREQPTLRFAEGGTA